MQGKCVTFNKAMRSPRSCADGIQSRSGRRRISGVRFCEESVIRDGKSLAALSAANPRQETSWKQPWSVQCYADKINHIRIDLLMVEKST